MDLEKLKSRHPATYRAARDEGAQRERHRVSSHIIMGRKSGDLKTAIAAIRSGADLSMEIQAQYMSAAINREDIRLHQAESDEAEATFENAKRPTGTHTDTFGEAVLDRLAVLLGVGEVGCEEASAVTCPATPRATHPLRPHAPNAEPAPTAPENLSNTGATLGTPDAPTSFDLGAHCATGGGCDA